MKKPPVGENCWLTTSFPDSCFIIPFILRLDDWLIDTKNT